MACGGLVLCRGLRHGLVAMVTVVTVHRLDTKRAVVLGHLDLRAHSRQAVAVALDHGHTCPQPQGQQQQHQPNPRFTHLFIIAKDTNAGGPGFFVGVPQAARPLNQARPFGWLAWWAVIDVPKVSIPLGIL